MKPAHVLVVDDEPNILFVLERTLRREGYQIDTASGGVEALEKIRRSKYQLVMLDLNMQPVDGLQVLSTLRAQDSNAVVIILTAHSTIESAVEAMHLGAFDYLFKPASPEVIRQRVREGLQRYEQNIRRLYLLEQIEGLRQKLQAFDDEDRLEAGMGGSERFTRLGHLVIDHHHRAVTLAGRLLDLTTTEFDLLACLVEASPRPVPPRQLVTRALGYDSGDMGAREIIKWHIHQLRQKVEPDPNKPVYIKTVRYKGYMWNS
ncbi:MAG: response regulator transcription factor [Chloroflexi bacterium]|nr:response regulator transcription factor [Anaerolineaceae bacterium]NMB88355.1 response regulator transcription factor [Chloroflexota bacterium]